MAESLPHLNLFSGSFSKGCILWLPDVFVVKAEPTLVNGLSQNFFLCQSAVKPAILKALRIYKLQSQLHPAWRDRRAPPKALAEMTIGNGAVFNDVSFWSNQKKMCNCSKGYLRTPAMATDPHLILLITQTQVLSPSVEYVPSSPPPATLLPFPYSPPPRQHFCLSLTIAVISTVCTAIPVPFPFLLLVPRCAIKTESFEFL